MFGSNLKEGKGVEQKERWPRRSRRRGMSRVTENGKPVENETKANILDLECGGRQERGL